MHFTVCIQDLKLDGPCQEYNGCQRIDASIVKGKTVWQWKIRD